MPRKPFWDVGTKSNGTTAQPSARDNTTLDPSTRELTKLTSTKSPNDRANHARTNTNGTTPRGTNARSRSYADLLDTLYTQFQDLSDEIALSTDSPTKKASALKDMARILPLLAQAEQAATTKVRNKDIKQLTDNELTAAVQAALRTSATPDSPFDPQRGALVAPPSENRKNQVDVAPSHTPDAEALANYLEDDSE